MIKPKPLTFIIITITIMFIFLVIHSMKSNKNRLLRKYDFIELKIDKINKYKGVVLMNDSIAVFGNTPRIVKDSFFNGDKLHVRYEFFENLRAPFTLVKKKNNDTIIVVKEYETLYYKLDW